MADIPRIGDRQGNCVQARRGRLRQVADGAPPKGLFGLFDDSKQPGRVSTSTRHPLRWVHASQCELLHPQQCEVLIHHSKRKNVRCFFVQHLSRELQNQGERIGLERPFLRVEE
jgi:hypothetical protein